jgi:L-rhamnose mutarotase
MVKRIGQVIGIKPEHIEEYEKLHAKAWPGVLAKIAECNIRNYSIYRYGNTLFAYMEYVGDDFEADMAKMAADETTQKWWDVCKPMQQPVDDRAAGEWWHDLKEVFHTDGSAS